MDEKTKNKITSAIHKYCGEDVRTTVSDYTYGEDPGIIPTFIITITFEDGAKISRIGNADGLSERYIDRTIYFSLIPDVLKERILYLKQQIVMLLSKQ